MNETNTQLIEEIEIIDNEEIEIHDDLSDQEWISAVLNQPVFNKSRTPEVVCIGCIDPETRKKEGIKLFEDTVIENKSMRNEEDSSCILNERSEEKINDRRKGKVFYGKEEMDKVTGCLSDSLASNLKESSSSLLNSNENKDLNDDIDQVQQHFSSTSSCEEELCLSGDKMNEIKEMHDFIEIEEESQRYCREELSGIEKVPTQRWLLSQNDLHSSLLFNPVFHERKTLIPSQIISISQTEEERPRILSQLIQNRINGDITPLRIFSQPTQQPKQNELEMLKRKMEVFEWYDRELKALFNEKERRLRQIEMESNSTQPEVTNKSQRINISIPKIINKPIVRVSQITPLRSLNESIINSKRGKVEEETKPKIRKNGAKWKRFTNDTEIIKWIKNQPMYEDILLYNAVDLDDCIHIFKTSGYLVTKKYLREFFEKNGVNYNDVARENANKRGAGNF